VLGTLLSDFNHSALYLGHAVGYFSWKLLLIGWLLGVFAAEYIVFQVAVD
jgi:hypothetical protein